MDLLKGLKKENIETLSELWGDSRFQKFVEILRISQENFAKMCLTRPTWQQVQELQWYASGFSMVIKIVEDCYNKTNNIKRRKKNDRRSK